MEVYSWWAYANTASVITLTVETGVRLKSSLVEIRTDILSHLTFVKPLDLFLKFSPLRLFSPSVHMEGHRTITRGRGVVVRGKEGQ